LNGRNYTFLAQVSAGVTVSQSDTRGFNSSGSFSAKPVPRAVRPVSGSAAPFVTTLSVV
jgi:hypothetical protein